MKFCKLILLFLVLSVFLVACTNTQQTKLPDGNTLSYSDNNHPNQQSIESQEPVTSMPLSNEQIEDLYKEAVRVWNWYNNNGMPVDETDVKEHNGYNYIKVNDSKINTLADLEKHVHSVFDEDIASRLLSDPIKFCDIDGNLYTVFSDGGSLIGKEAKFYEVITENDNKVIYRITTNIVEDKGDKFEVTGEKVYDEIFEYIDDAWKCTQFEYLPIV